MSHPPDPSYVQPRPVETRLGTVWLADEGRGPVVIAIPGLPGTHRDFRWMAPAVARYGRFIRLDMPGFGLTPLRRGVRPRAAWRADLVAAVADALECDRFAAIAHSMSGPVLASLAARYPSRVVAAGFIACGGSRPHRLWRQMPLSPRITSELLAHPTRARLLLPLARRMFAAVGFPVDISDDAVTTAVHCAAATDFAAVRRDLCRIAAPCLVAHAEDDPIIDTALADEIAACVPAGPRLRLFDGGHALMKVHACEIADALQPLVTGRPRPSRDTDRPPAARVQIRG